VQPQTRILMRALQRLTFPTLLFVNKIDRAGSGSGRVLDEIEQRLTPEIVPDGLGPTELGRGRDVRARSAADDDLAERRAARASSIPSSSALRSPAPGVDE
jgi:ribosomal protection tetracycline resistance protein